MPMREGIPIDLPSSIEEAEALIDRYVRVRQNGGKYNIKMMVVDIAESIAGSGRFKLIGHHGVNALICEQTEIFVLSM